MATVLGTLPKNQMGIMNRSQEREPSPWEFGTSVNQEVSLLTFDYPSLSISLLDIQCPRKYVPLARTLPPSSLLMSTLSY